MSTSPAPHRPVALIIRDGWGISPASGNDHQSPAAVKEGNSTLLAKTPFHDHLYATYPQSRLSASGLDVGLPEGQMGNSEVGHLNLGAGRIVYQDLTRINKAIADGEFAKNPVLAAFLADLKAKNGALHLFGLLSDGGVHSSQEHLYAFIEAAKAAGIAQVYVHAFLDGRDTPPSSGLGYVKALQAQLARIGHGTLATMIGRYFAMDRDNRWERVKQAYDLVVSGIGAKAADPIAAIEAAYAAGKTDEFFPATVLVDHPRPLIADGDAILFTNFRSDRARQLSHVFLDPEFKGFETGKVPRVAFATMTAYDATFGARGVKVLYGPQSMKNILGEVVSAAGKTQLRMAETEKYPHVTYFFNGGVEIAYPGEDREMAASPKVATYDLQPEMSAPELTGKVLARLDTGKYDLLILNFANPDMVGHTGIVEAGIKAVEEIDRDVEKVVNKILSLGGAVLVTADHGNCERLIAEDGTPHTAHTTNLVHFLYVGADHESVELKNGVLADVAPTLLDLLGVPQPAEMTGHSLIVRK
ncbi:phosphoglycerate mutase [Verrucomicrobium sp. GAS474]|uniref:2,3-bisphosphoglycerate-independent phosphoglycerate mutase n=1 Tax=Verrucomicrobium sp. GAS474 TaxID=1882831 RepID=UPI00087CEB98|nr:2,3-bisphosphoglycerate-independent phosphoglycerate mutase [Verrucomicrobium sp. GAS474]SDU26765.1 phosphoglycerate mutase [Verrucomicrobium sp. GAS474]